MPGQLLGLVVLPALVALIVVGVRWLEALSQARGAARSALARSIAASVAALVVGAGAIAGWTAGGGAKGQDVRIASAPLLGAVVAVREASRVRVLRPAAAGSLLTAAALWLTIGPMTNSVTQNLRMSAPDAPSSPGDWVQNLGFVATGLGCILFAAGMVALRWPGAVLPSTTGTVAAERA